MEERAEVLMLPSWWGLIVRGLLAIVFGILTMVVPGLTLGALILLFAAYAFVEGVVNVVAAVKKERRAEERWWVLLLEGLVSIGAGVVAIAWPGITALALVVVIAVWALMTGALEISAAIRLRKQVQHEWLLLLSGILSIALGVLLLLNPGAGALVMVFWIGAYAIVFGGMMVFLGIRLRLHEHAPVSPAPPAAPPLATDRQQPAH